MYSISIYFDEKTNRTIQNYINRVAEKTGNHFMVEGNVPPHITLSMFETRHERKVIEAMERVVEGLEVGQLKWVSIGTFLPYVIHLTPVLNEYLHNLEQMIYACLENVEGTKISPYYRPFQWLAHTTIGKKLSQEELRVAFEVLQKEFSVFEGSVTAIGLAKTNPYQSICVWKLKQNGV